MKVIKVPSSQGGLGKADGSELGPDKIIEQTKDLFMNESGIIPFFDIETVDVVSSNIEETNENIYKKALGIFNESNGPVFLGGDHSITFPIVKAFSQKYENPGIIIFDAHLDAVNDFMPPSQEDLVTGLVNQKIIKPSNIILVGTRNWHQNEIDFIRQNKIKFYSMRELSIDGKEEVSDSIMSVAKNFGALYISIDIDVLDPAFAPGTGYIEPGGLTTRELLYFLFRLKNLRNIKGYDVVEVNPKKDVNDMTSKVGAKILVELG
jgi:agmatinase